jgi:hypothetical protein
MYLAEYKDWWQPVIEQIVIKKKSQNSNPSVSTISKTSTAGAEATSPRVFISYQWGKQKQVQALYKRLSELGYDCWMDIYQMGGGDSLFDKIDRGIRGCNVVISCLTPKYALSANCRREISLADALKKPIIPLLLEETRWPPPGPMSMVFTQLLYIDMNADPDMQTIWTGGNFEQLIDQLKQHLPDNIDTKHTGALPNPKGSPVAECKHSGNEDSKHTGALRNLNGNPVAAASRNRNGNPIAGASRNRNGNPIAGALRNRNGNPISESKHTDDVETTTTGALANPKGNPGTERKLDGATTVDGKKKFDAKKEWSKVRNVGMAVRGINPNSQACNIL